MKYKIYHCGAQRDHYQALYEEWEGEKVVGEIIWCRHPEIIGKEDGVEDIGPKI